MSEFADRDDLAAILAKHRETKTEATRNGCRCECGEPICTDLGGMSHDWHYRAHVAQMVLESDWLRGVRAKELRDAADAVKEVRDRGLPPSCHSHPTHQYIENWLRDRADRVDAEDGADSTTERT